METIINTYEATATNGSTVTVYEVQESDNARTLENPNQESPGIKHLELSDGRRLTLVGERQVKVDGTDDVFLLDRPYVP